MGCLLMLVLIGVPFAELYVIVQVGQSIGILPTLALMLVMSAAGAFLLRQQGSSTWRRLQTALREGRVPADEVTDGAMILFGGALLLTPGFLTDVVGLLLLLPPSRAMIRRGTRRSVARMAKRRVELRYLRKR